MNGGHCALVLRPLQICSMRSGWVDQRFILLAHRCDHLVHPLQQHLLFASPCGNALGIGAAQGFWFSGGKGLVDLEQRRASVSLVRQGARIGEQAADELLSWSREENSGMVLL